MVFLDGKTGRREDGQAREFRRVFGPPFESSRLAVFLSQHPHGKTTADAPYSMRSVLIAPAQTESLDPVDQRAASDAQPLGSARLVAVLRTQRIEDRLP